MTSTRIEASCQAYRSEYRQTAYEGCPHCHRRLTIVEIAERHCDECGKSISPREVQEGRA